MIGIFTWEYILQVVIQTQVNKYVGQLIPGKI